MNILFRNDAEDKFRVLQENIVDASTMIRESAVDTATILQEKLADKLEVLQDIAANKFKMLWDSAVNKAMDFRDYAIAVQRGEEKVSVDDVVMLSGKVVLGTAFCVLVWMGIQTSPAANASNPPAPKEAVVVTTTEAEPVVETVEVVKSEEEIIRDQARATAEKYGIPPELFFALITQESAWDHKAVSHAGAIGLTQVMPFNIKAMGYDVNSFINSPESQLEAGARYLSAQYKRFGRWDFALAAYNAGPGAVRKYGGVPPYKETTRYVKRILEMTGWS